MSEYELINNDCIEELASFDDGVFDSVVCDAPYELKFMNQKWDGSGIAYNVEMWAEVLRVLKPGGHLLSFGAPRTFHRMAVAIEDAGFELRDTIMWLYGSGFPKSHNVALGIDKALGHENRGRAIPTASTFQASDIEKKNKLTSNAVGPYEAKTDEAKPWEGWGTALKPAYEPIVMARKPFKGSLAKNVLAGGVGGINVDDSRIGDEVLVNQPGFGRWNDYRHGDYQDCDDGVQPTVAEGRWPANVMLDEESSKALDKSVEGVSRFFYCSKASKKEKGAGCDHPTVKPLDLMKYLVRLVTPRDGIVLDHFMGSGTTGMACLLSGFNFVGIEQDPEYFKIAQERLGELV